MSLHRRRYSSESKNRDRTHFEVFPVHTDTSRDASR